MSIKDFAINFDGQTLFKVQRNETFTVPDTKSSPSPTGLSSGVSPVTTFDAKRATVGGALYAAFDDVAGPTNAADLHFRLQPGDIVAVSNASPAVVTINGETVASITNTAVAGVLGFWG